MIGHAHVLNIMPDYVFVQSDNVLGFCVDPQMRGTASTISNPNELIFRKDNLLLESIITFRFFVRLPFLNYIEIELADIRLLQWDGHEPEDVPIKCGWNQIWTAEHVATAITSTLARIVRNHHKDSWMLPYLRVHAIRHIGEGVWAPVVEIAPLNL
jgi:hypothetical protein